MHYITPCALTPGRMRVSNPRAPPLCAASARHWSWRGWRRARRHHCGRPVLSHRPNPKSLAARRARLRARQCLPLARAPLAAGALPPMWKPGMGNDAANASTRLRISGMRGSTSSALPGAARRALRPGCSWPPACARGERAPKRGWSSALRCPTHAQAAGRQ